MPVCIDHARDHDHSPSVDDEGVGRVYLVIDGSDAIAVDEDIAWSKVAFVVVHRDDIDVDFDTARDRATLFGLRSKAFGQAERSGAFLSPQEFKTDHAGDRRSKPLQGAQARARTRGQTSGNIAQFLPRNAIGDSGPGF